MSSKTHKFAHRLLDLVREDLEWQPSEATRLELLDRIDLWHWEVEQLTEEELLEDEDA